MGDSPGGIDCELRYQKQTATLVARRAELSDRASLVSTGESHSLSTDQPHREGSLPRIRCNLSGVQLDVSGHWRAPDLSEKAGYSRLKVRLRFPVKWLGETA